MGIENDDTLQLFIEESSEHLADIENDFLAIEEAGANLNDDLINKVYRAAHSIKGGAGFLGLTTIKNLTHEMENILGKFRCKELIPNPEIINILLLASDLLRDLINNVQTSNEVDISEHLRALSAVDGEPADHGEKTSATGTVDISSPDESFGLCVEEDRLASAWEEGKYIYLLKIDFIQDIHHKGKTLEGVLDEIQTCGALIDSKIDTDAVGTLDAEVLPEQMPWIAVFATILQPTDVNGLLEIDEHSIFEITKDLTVRSIEPRPSEDVSASESGEAFTGSGQYPPGSARQQEPPGLNEPACNSADIQSQGQTSPSPEVESSLRVNVGLLDSLMTLAGEMVLSRNQLLQSTTSKDQHAAEISVQRIDHITSELQEAIMLTRMQSIGNVFNKFPRVVRDLSRTLGKRIELSMEGKDVELDKTIIEAIGDPLTHLVRNAVDHGIELPDDRQRAGKDTAGKIFLKAYHEAGQVNIEISDDGKGLDGNELAAVAVNKGLLTKDRTRMMSENEKLNLIFMPGFSTAKEVTDVSGRGVGMDVVKTNLDRLGGVVDIDSQLGHGTTIRIKLPLTLAIIPCQIIVCGEERYAIPQVNLEELLRIPADQVKDKIEIVGNAEVVRLRGKLLPLIKLADVIGVESTYLDPNDNKTKTDRRQNIADRRSKESPLFDEEIQDSNRCATRNRQPATRNPDDRRYHAASALNIAVVSTGAMKYGMVVDRLNDSEEIVVKPLGRHLKHCKGYAGATIMGDGRVALILDVANIAQMADLTTLDGTDRAAAVAGEKNEAIQANRDRQSLLIFRSAEDQQFAVSLNLVERIERIRRADIEDVGGRSVIQYRGGSLPLFVIDQVAQVKPLADKADLLVIVFELAGREFGLLGVGPVDAVEITAEIDDATLKQPGILGSTIIGDHTTLLIDVFGLAATLNPEWFANRDTVQTVDGSAPTILYAEDSNFFRNQVKNFMQEEGYNVIEAEDGMIAWNLLQQHAGDISLIVTDIEMPNLDGFGLAEKIKGDRRFNAMPIIAITTLAGDEDIAKGKSVGIDDYQVKLDREKLLASVHQFIEGRQPVGNS